MKTLEYILQNKSDFLKYLKSRFPLYHDSNVFFRDIHYGVLGYVDDRLKRKIKYLDAEGLAVLVCDHLEKEGIFKRVDEKTWTLQYPEFALPRPEPTPKAAAKAPAQTPAS